MLLLELESCTCQTRQKYFIHGYYSNIYHIIGRIFLCSSLNKESLPYWIEIVQFLCFGASCFTTIITLMLASSSDPNPDFCFCFVPLIHLYSPRLLLSSYQMAWYKCIGMIHYQILLLWFVKYLNNFSWGRLKKGNNSGNTDLYT